MNPSRPTSPSSSWLVAIVVPWLTADTAEASAPSKPSTFVSPSANPIDGSAGVVGVFVTVSSPLLSSYATTSVNVPPVSIPTRSRLVIAGRSKGSSPARIGTVRATELEQVARRDRHRGNRDLLSVLDRGGEQCG